MPLVFTYGTLMYGLSAHHLLVGCEFVGRGFVKAKLYLCDGYPLAVLGEDGRVWGELYNVPENRIPHIDHYEGADLADSPWRRLQVEVDVIGLKVKAYIYASPSREHASRRCDRLEELGEEDYRDVAKAGPPRWLVISHPLSQPPGVVIGSWSGVLQGYSLAENCFAEGGSEVVEVVDVLCSRRALEEWVSELGCRLAGVRVRIDSLTLYPLAPVISR